MLQLAHERSGQIKLPVDESRDFVIIFQYSTSMMTLHNFIILIVSSQQIFIKLSSALVEVD